MAMVNVRNANGDLVACRLLLDRGSELSYVSEPCIQTLGLARTLSRILVTGISSIKADTIRGCSTICIQSCISQDQLVVQVHVLGKITLSLERQAIDASELRVFNDLQLADSQFSTNAPIDILLGSEHVWSVISGRQIYDNKGKLIATLKHHCFHHAHATLQQQSTSMLISEGSGNWRAYSAK